MLAIEGPDFRMLADRSGDQGQGPLLDMHSEESVTYFGDGFDSRHAIFAHAGYRSRLQRDWMVAQERLL